MGALHVRYLSTKKRRRGGEYRKRISYGANAYSEKKEKRKTKNSKSKKRKNSSFKPIFVLSSRIHVIYWSYFGFCVKSMCFIGVFISISGISGCVFNFSAIIAKILSAMFFWLVWALI